MDLMMPVLFASPLFVGIARKELKGLLRCLDAKRKAYGREETILRYGDAVTRVGVVCRGGVQIIREDFVGNRRILARMGVGDLFGEAFACAGMGLLTVNIEAVEDTEILWIDYQRIMATCASSCPFHSRLLENMMRVLAVRNIQLNRKTEILSKRSTREKLIAYLTTQAQESQGLRFTIPLNRQELADYLCVERSAMCAELGKMKRDGLIDYNKSFFILHFPTH